MWNMVEDNGLFSVRAIIVTIQNQCNSQWVRPCQNCFFWSRKGRQGLIQWDHAKLQRWGLHSLLRDPVPCLDGPWEWETHPARACWLCWSQPVLILSGPFACSHLRVASVPLLSQKVKNWLYNHPLQKECMTFELLFFSIYPEETPKFSEPEVDASPQGQDWRAPAFHWLSDLAWLAPH